MTLYATRKVDELGRIVLPRDLRKNHQIEDETAIDICEDANGQIILRKSEPSCKICGETDCLSEVAQKNIFICCNCKRSIKEMDT